MPSVQLHSRLCRDTRARLVGASEKATCGNPSLDRTQAPSGHNSELPLFCVVESASCPVGLAPTLRSHAFCLSGPAPALADSTFQRHCSRHAVGTHYRAT